MITVTNIRNMHPTRYHYAFASVHSLKKRIPYVTQLQALSPAPQIFYKYLRLQKEGKWNQATFDDWYTKAFLHQLSQDTVAQDTLRHILRLDREGKNIVLASGKWNQATFDDWYTKAFLHQLSQDTVAQDTLRHILRLDREGKNIVLASFCSDANMCHRTIIASILAENGADVRADGVLKRYGMML